MNDIEQLNDRVAYLEGIIANMMKSGEYTLNKNVTFQRNIQLKDKVNIAVESTTGTKIGTAATQKIGFFGATPVVQQGHYTTVDGHTIALTNLGLIAPA